MAHGGHILGLALLAACLAAASALDTPEYEENSTTTG